MAALVLARHLDHLLRPLREPHGPPLAGVSASIVFVTKGAFGFPFRGTAGMTSASPTAVDPAVDIEDAIALRQYVARVVASSVGKCVGV